jgi:DNA polymerase-3 subunit delta'
VAVSEEERPVPALFAEAVGQGPLVEQLRRLLRRPVHAYALIGPEGAGTAALARGMAAALLCSEGGCGACRACEEALGGFHPDLVWVTREGPQLQAAEVREAVRAAQRKPRVASRQVIVVPDLHLGVGVAPMLLKTVEEPAPGSVLLLLAERLPPALATIQSRCVVLRLRPVPEEELAAWLVEQGVPEDRARAAAQAAGGSPGTARLLAADEGLVTRLARWRSLPGRLAPEGHVLAALAKELAAGVEEALGALAAKQAEELAPALARVEGSGERTGPLRKAIEERQHRAQRRWRVEEWRRGLAALAQAYRDQALADPRGRGATRAAAALELLAEAARDLRRNPAEQLWLEALLARLAALG